MIKNPFKKSKTKSDIDNAAKGSIGKNDLDSKDLAYAFQSGKLSPSAISSLSSPELKNVLETKNILGTTNIINLDSIDNVSLQAIDPNIFKNLQNNNKKIEAAFNNSKNQNLIIQNPADNILQDLKVNKVDSNIRLDLNKDLNFENYSSRITDFVAGKSKDELNNIYSKNNKRISDIEFILKKNTDLSDQDIKTLKNELESLQTTNIAIDLDNVDVSSTTSKSVMETNSIVYNTLFKTKTRAAMSILIGMGILSSIAYLSINYVINKAKNEGLDKAKEILEKAMNTCGSFSDKINAQLEKSQNEELEELKTLYTKWLTPNTSEDENTFLLTETEIKRFKELVPELKNDNLSNSFDTCINTTFDEDVEEEKKKNDEDGSPLKVIERTFKNIGDWIKDPLGSLDPTIFFWIVIAIVIFVFFLFF